jgi:hypothetical protein
MLRIPPPPDLPSLCKLRKQVIGQLLFLQGLIQEIGCVTQAELTGPGHQRAVPRQFIVLDRLSR